MPVPPDIDCNFDDAPLVLALAQISFTESPELIQEITDVKADLSGLDLPIAQSKNQTSFSMDSAGGAPSVSQKTFWWFTSLDKYCAVAVAQNSVVLYDAAYAKYDQFIEKLKRICQIVETHAGNGCFLKSVALRYVSGFASDGDPSPYIANSLHGLSTAKLETDHFHHQYHFWCSTNEGGRLVVNVKTVHGNQLIPQDVLSTELAIDPKFSLKKEIGAVQLDIHETIQKKTMERFEVDEIERIFGEMRKNIKQVFLMVTTPEAHSKWSITS